MRSWGAMAVAVGSPADDPAAARPPPPALPVGDPVLAGPPVLALLVGDPVLAGPPVPALLAWDLVAAVPSGAAHPAGSPGPRAVDNVRGAIKYPPQCPPRPWLDPSHVLLSPLPLCTPTAS